MASLSSCGYLLKSLPAVIRSTLRWHWPFFFMTLLSLRFVTGKASHHSIRIITVYYTLLHVYFDSAFLDEFCTYLENVIMCSEPLIIAGDFNFHLVYHSIH